MLQPVTKSGGNTTNARSVTKMRAGRLHAWYCIVAGASTAPLFWQDNERYNANGVPITDMRDDA